MKVPRILAIIALAAIVAAASFVQAQGPTWSWYALDSNRNVRVNLYLFWSEGCPNCAEALRFASGLQQRHAWLNVYRYEIKHNPANRDLYQRMAASLGRTAGQTPAFAYCKQLEIGYFSYEQNGRRIEQGLVRYHDALKNHFRQSAAPRLALAGMLIGGPTRRQAAFDPQDLPDLPVELPPEEETVSIPGWGTVAVNSLSLPVLTLVLAGCDAFNPCAFFVLLLLLSLLAHGQKRSRMLLVGGIFVCFSGLMYFLFMAAWLNLFFVIGHLQIITLAAGALAIVIGLLNVKDFFWFKRGPSLSIPDSARPGLFQRMTRLINASSLPSLLLGAAALATTANLYELLCTAGFPMVYTRVLTLSELPPTAYYGYLVLYNLIYVAPMALIVVGFAWTLGSRKLTEQGGRVLKLLSGVMMLGLGVLLMAWPEALHSVGGAVAVLTAAAGVTAAIVALDRRRGARGGRKVEPLTVPSSRPDLPASRGQTPHLAERSMAARRDRL